MLYIPKKLNKLYISLPGCGKSYNLVQDARKDLEQNKIILYLTFGKDIRFEIASKQGFNISIAKTIHSLCHEEVIKDNVLLEIEKKYPKKVIKEIFGTINISEKNIELNEEKLYMLLDFWLEFINTKSKFNNLDSIYADDSQDQYILFPQVNIIS